MESASSLLCTTDDIAAITGRVRPAAQRRALDRVRIPYRVRPDGKPIVARATIERGGGDVATVVEPDWGRIR